MLLRENSFLLDWTKRANLLSLLQVYPLLLNSAGSDFNLTFTVCTNCYHICHIQSANLDLINMADVCYHKIPPVSYIYLQRQNNLHFDKICLKAHPKHVTDQTAVSMQSMCSLPQTETGPFIKLYKTTLT